MLILQRKINESIIINGDIEITIVDIIGDKVKIGINAPLDVKILRKEIVLVQEENKKASASLNKEGIMKIVKDLDEKSKS